MTSGRHKIRVLGGFATAALIAGLLAPGPTTPRWNDAELLLPKVTATPLAEARPSDVPGGGTSSCGAVRRKLRFGWIDPVDEDEPLTRREPAVCLAVYQLPDAPLPRVTRQ